MKLNNRFALCSACLGCSLALGTMAFGQVRPAPAAPAKPTAATPAAPAGAATSSYQAGQAVEAREGDEWSAATVLKKEGRKYQIRYGDGTEEWVTPDRLRTPGAAAPAGAGAGAGAGATTAPAAGAKPAQKEAFAVGAKVEAKEASQWKPATVKNRDGDNYLIVFQGWENQIFWQWLPVTCVRKVGSDKAGPRWAQGVHVGRDVNKAREEARVKFANAEKDLAAEQANGGRGPDPFAPQAYDKPITEIKADDAAELLLGDGPAKLAVFDPAPATTKLAERGGFVLKGRGARGSGAPAAVFLAGTRAVAAYTNDGLGSETRSTSLEILDLAGGRNLGLVDADPLSMPADLSPSGERIVGVQHGFHSGTRVRLDLHMLKPSAPLQHVVSFIPFAGGDAQRWHDIEYARFVGDDDHVLTGNRSGELILWDAPKAKALWRLKLATGATPAVSPGRKQIAVINQGALLVLDGISGRVLCRIAGERAPHALAFSPDGKHLVGLSGRSVCAWDLDTGKASPEIGMPAKSAFGDVVALSERFALIGGSDLLDLDKKIVVWRYSGGGSTFLAHGGRCWTLTSDSGRNVLAGAVLPHAAAVKAADAVKPGDGLLVRPGGSVALSVSIEATSEQQQKIGEAMTAQLQRQGIRVDPASPVKLSARTETGKTTEQQYERREFGRGPWNRETEKVAVTEKITRIFFEYDGKVAWESRTSSGVPMFVRAKEGQSIGQAVQAASVFNIAFLESVRVPAYVPLPSETPWLGTSTWSVNGIGNDRRIADALGAGPRISPPPANANADAAPANKRAANKGDGLE